MDYVFYVFFWNAASKKRKKSRFLDFQKNVKKRILELCRGASDQDPAGSEVGSGKYWPDVHNYDIKHHSILSFQEMTHYNTELYMKTH